MLTSRFQLDIAKIFRLLTINIHMLYLPSRNHIDPCDSRHITCLSADAYNLHCQAERIRGGWGFDRGQPPHFFYFFIYSSQKRDVNIPCLPQRNCPASRIYAGPTGVLRNTKNCGAGHLIFYPPKFHFTKLRRINSDSTIRNYLPKFLE